MLKNVLIIKDYKGFVRQGEHYVSSLNINTIKSTLESKGFKVETIYYDEVIDKIDQLNNYVILYSSTENLEYKAYLDDLLYSLSKTNMLIPSYEIFKAHENKGYQEILKKEKNINSLGFNYFSVLEDIQKNISKITYPVILKTVSGSSSRGVYKVNNNKELLNIVKKNSEETLKEKLKYRVKKTVLSKFTSKYNTDYFNESKFIKRFVLQEYAEGNNEDWKVLIFHSKYYVLNRKAKEGDFKASGSGIRNFENPPEGLLNYARSIFEKLDVPFISMDVVSTKNGFELIEFQGTHFGLYTILQSPNYFYMDNEKWVSVEEKSDASKEYAISIINYYKQKVIQ